jgi:hypothetical protein
MKNPYFKSGTEEQTARLELLRWHFQIKLKNSVFKAVASQNGKEAQKQKSQTRSKNRLRRCETGWLAFSALSTK